MLLECNPFCNNIRYQNPALKYFFQQLSVQQVSRIRLPLSYELCIRQSHPFIDFDLSLWNIWLLFSLLRLSFRLLFLYLKLFLVKFTQHTDRLLVGRIVVGKAFSQQHLTLTEIPTSVRPTIIWNLRYERRIFFQFLYSPTKNTSKIN